MIIRLSSSNSTWESDNLVFIRYQATSGSGSGNEKVLLLNRNDLRLRLRLRLRINLAGNEVAPKRAASSTIFSLNLQDAVGAGKCLSHGFLILLLIRNGAKYISPSDVTVMQNQSSFTSLCHPNYSTDGCDKTTTE